ncbi:unnamed protein product, partial [Laminaria digitata]
DDGRSSAKQGKKSVGPSVKSGAKIGGVTKTVMGTPISRRPLGALGQGNTRIGGNGSGSSRDGPETKGVKTLHHKAVRTAVVAAAAPKQTGGSAPKQAGGNGGVGGGSSSTSASMQRKVGPVPSTSTTGGGGGAKRPRPAVRPGTVVNAVPVVRNGKVERPRNLHDSSAGRTSSGGAGSGPGGGLRNGTVGVKSSGAVTVSSSNHAKRVRVEASVKPATTPSFLKPTKSSGAHVSAGLQARSSGGG